jgi:hypothetical protein
MFLDQAVELPTQVLILQLPTQVLILQLSTHVFISQNTVALLDKWEIFLEWEFF